MSIQISVATNAYSDFALITEGIRNKGMVYYYNSAPTRWSIWFVTDDGSHLVQLIGATGSFPSSFPTDFPNAIALTFDHTFSIG